MKSIVYLAAGAVISAVVIVACSDDSPQDADAATCDCPASEAPITAARVVRVDNVATVATNSDAAPIAMCPAGSLLLSGSCYVDEDNTGRELSLVSSGAQPASSSMPASSWACAFDNKSLAGTATVRAQVSCLLPAP